MLGNTRISITVISTWSCKYLINLIVWTRGKPPLYNKCIIWGDQGRGQISVWLSGPKVQTRKKSGFAITDVTNQYSRNLLKKLKMHLIRVTKVNRFIMDQLRITFY